jgi:glucose-6-phosphate 1-dehydrogenase
MSAAPAIVAPCELAEELPVARPVRRAGPCTMIILGARGDLTSRKLMPALAHLAADGALDPAFAIIGVARDEMTDDAFRAAMRDAIEHSTETGELSADALERFLQRLHYVSGDLHTPDTYARIAQCLAGVEGEHARERGRLFYLAIPPSLYPDVLRRLSESGLAPRVTRDIPSWVRIIIEKPFGHDFASARALNELARASFMEGQIYRIDHYLGKETVQNLLVLRFANSIFEPIWNRDHVHHVQITAAEAVGVEHRAGYYEEAGVLRDMFQNHLLQLLALTAMEPPNTFAADAVRDEKVKVLGAVRVMAPEAARTESVVGQYGAGRMDGVRVPGYRQEPGVSQRSRVPTYAALRLTIDNWRWSGVPFFLRSGKRMTKRVTEIAVRFRRPPHLMFRLRDGERLDPNVLVIRIQPDEGISAQFEVKVPGVEVAMTSVRMTFSYADAFGPATHSAYETLLLDAMLGDATLFARGDQVEAAWRIVDPVIEGWRSDSAGEIPVYSAGEWGPAAADALIGRDGAAWRTP